MESAPLPKRQSRGSGTKRESARCDDFVFENKKNKLEIDGFC